MKEILEDIKSGNFHRAYLLYGSEAYLKNQYRQKLLDALLPEGDTMNFSRFEGKGQNEGEIIDLAETMPFFADHRVILLENTGFFKNKADRLADYLSSLPEYLVLIFVEDEVDKRSRTYKALQKTGIAVEFGQQKEDALIRWILGILKKSGKKITRPDMELFLGKTGTDMGNIHMELQKLLDYAEGREIIRAQDIEAICTTQLSNRIFDMIRAVTEKRQREALQLYYDLLALKEPSMRILFLLARQMNQLLIVKDLAEAGETKDGIAKAMGLRPFVAGKLLGQSRAFTFQELRSFLQICVEAEESVKRGALGEKLAVEMLIVRIARRKEIGA